LKLVGAGLDFIGANERAPASGLNDRKRRACKSKAIKGDLTYVSLHKNWCVLLF
jgi:hypothetical protein